MPAIVVHDEPTLSAAHNWMAIIVEVRNDVLASLRHCDLPRPVQLCATAADAVCARNGETRETVAELHAAVHLVADEVLCPHCDESTHHHIDMADHKQESHNSGKKDAEKSPGRDGGDDIHQRMQLLTRHAQRSARGVIYQHERWTSTYIRALCVQSGVKSRCCVSCKSFRCRHHHVQASHLQGLLWNIVVCELEITAFYPSHPSSWWSRCDAKALCGKRRHTQPASAGSGP